MKVFRRAIALAAVLVSGAATSVNAETLLCLIKPNYGAGLFGPEMIISTNRITGTARILDGVILDRNGGPVLSKFTTQPGKLSAGYRLNLPTRNKGNRPGLFRLTWFEETGHLNLFVTIEFEGVRKAARGTCKRSDQRFEDIKGFGTTRARPYLLL
ncbi:MAG: hypothetical protein AAF222_12195 [Pseudomonadota bacterium]